MTDSKILIFTQNYITAITACLNWYFFLPQITSNGFISVDKWSKSVDESLKHVDPILVPYNIRMHNRNKDIFYRITLDPRTLNLIDQDISLTLGRPGNPSTFKTTKAIIVTYNNVPKYGDSSKRFKYQVVIATDYTNTFAILNYDRLDESGGIVGYGDSGYCTKTRTFTDSSDTRTLNRTSNVGRPGKHIYLLTVKDVKYCWGSKTLNYNKHI